MKCKNCGSRVPISRPLLISVIAEGIVILFLLFVVFALGMVLATNDSADSNSKKNESVANQITNSVNSSPYYQNCNWCPNYGYVTGAKPTNWQLNTDNPLYEYPLEQEQLAKYTKELEKNLFEKNPYSGENMYVYSKQIENKTCSIVLSIDNKGKTILIYMEKQ